MCEILLIRHAEQQIYQNIPLGDALDAPLSPRGHQQAEALGARLASSTLGAVVCSPAARAHDTAKAVAQHHGLTPVVQTTLQEIDLWQRAPQDKGLLDLLSREEVVAMYREVGRTRLFSSFPYAEDREQFRARVRTAIDEIALQNEGRRVAVVCHGGVINAYLSEILGSRYDQIIPVHHTAISVVRAADSRRSVLTINDYSHVHSVQDALNEIQP